MAIKFLNSVNADSGVLYVDAANDKVGIGTTSPNRKLTIQNGSYTYPGGIDANSFFAIANDGWAGMNILSSRGTGGFIDFGDLDWGHRGRILYGQSTDYMSFDTAGSTKMTILSGGNVGIGTTSPEGKLNIVADNGSTASAVKTLVLGGGTDTTGNGQYIQFRSSSNATLGSQISGSRTGAGAASDLKFHTTGSDSVVRERMVINSSGNVGIGTTSPIGLLTVQGDDADIYLRSNDYTIARIINRGSSGTNLDTGLFSLMSSDGTNNNVEQVRLDAGGNSWLNALNVGIGTNSPASRLHVYENSDVWHAKFGSATGELRIGGQTSSGAVIQAYTPAGVVRDLYLQRDGGNVGIGTASPGAKLDISGDTTTWSGMAKIFLTDSNSNSNSRNWSIGNGGTDFGSLSFIVSNAKDGVPEASTGTPVMSMDGVNKRIGIGTASPTEKLHVSGNVRIEGDLTVNGSYTQIDTDVNTTEQWNVTNDGTGPAVTINQTGAQDIMDVQDDGTSVFYIEDGGNVGLGTTDPANNLEVSNSNSGGLGATLGIYNPGYNANSSSTINIGRTSDSNWEIKSESNADGGRDYDLIFSERDKDDTAHEEYLRLKSTGALKISSYGSNTFTGTAAYALAVDSSGNVIETAVQGSPTGGSGTAGKITKWDTSSTLTDSVITESSGNIGIGTASPSEKLEVLGDIRFGGSTNGDWAVLEHATKLVQFTQSNAGSAGHVMKFRTPGWSADAFIFTNGDTETMRITGTGNVGIGTTSPWDIGAGYTGLTIDDTTTGFLAIRSSGTTQVVLSANGSSYLNGGNVGIGTTNPSYKLDVEGDVGINDYIQHNGDNSRIGFPSNDVIALVTSNAERMRIASDGVLTVGGQTSTRLVTTITENDKVDLKVIDGTDSGRAFTFSTSNSERMRITAGGNVGIGTTSPSNKLHVYGGRLVLDNVANAQTAIQINSAGVEKIVIYRPASTEDLRINTFSAGDVFSLTQSGNVGIGTTSPSSKLEVVGTLTVGNIGTSRFTDTSAFPLQLNRGLDVDIYGANGVILGMGTIKSGTYKDAARIAGGLESNTGTDGNFSVQTRGGDSFTTALHINSSQNVGIGTTSPGSRLQVKDSQDSSFDSGIGIIRSNSSQTGYINMVGGAMNINAPSGIPIKLRDGGATNVTISGDGNVGIGTTSPSEKLEVNGNVKADNFIGGNDAGVYTFNDTVDASSSEDIFSIYNLHGAQAFRVTFVCSTSSYSVAKTFEVVHSHGNDPVFFKVVDTGAYSSNDFDVSFRTQAGGGSTDNNTVICEITNNSTTINADIVTTVFLGGSPTTITVTAL